LRRCKRGREGKYHKFHAPSAQRERSRDEEGRRGRAHRGGSLLERLARRPSAARRAADGGRGAAPKHTRVLPGRRVRALPGDAALPLRLPGHTRPGVQKPRGNPSRSSSGALPALARSGGADVFALHAETGTKSRQALAARTSFQSGAVLAGLRSGSVGWRSGRGGGLGTGWMAELRGLASVVLSLVGGR